MATRAQRRPRGLTRCCAVEQRPILAGAPAPRGRPFPGDASATATARRRAAGGRPLGVGGSHGGRAARHHVGRPSRAGALGGAAAAERPAQRLRRGATDPAPRRRGRHPRADPAVVPGTGRVDAARVAPSEDTRSAILIEAVQRGLASVDDLAEWVHRLPRDAAALHAPLEHAASGAWSTPESEVLELVAESSVLSPAWANPWLERPDGSALTAPDVWFDDVAMAVMVHSRRYHAEADDWDDTVEADADLVAAGVVVVVATPRRIRTDPARVLRRLERAYLAAAARPRPAVVARPRLVDRCRSAG